MDTCVFLFRTATIQYIRYKQSWLAAYATGISAILRDQFGILPKRRAIGYTKPYPSDYDLIPLPPKYQLSEFTKFSGVEGSSSIEHVS
jgi:hypothetical protein